MRIIKQGTLFCKSINSRLIGDFEGDTECELLTESMVPLGISAESEGFDRRPLTDRLRRDDEDRDFSGERRRFERAVPFKLDEFVMFFEAEEK